jgi:DNA-binding response OmpR family regulator
MQPSNERTPDYQNILVIEDEGDMSLLIDLVLYNGKMRINHAKSLSAALKYLQNEQPSLILLDNRLPDGYGLDFISFMKALYPAVKIIMISGVDNAARDIALEIGADFFLSKPFTKMQLKGAVNELLN